jgi:hypothetical protein
MTKSLNNNIEELNQISSRNLWEFEGIEHLASLLVRNSSVTTWLSFYGKSLGDKGVRHISQLLLHNTCILKITLGRNSIKGLGMKYLADGIKINSMLAGDQSLAQ